MIPSLDPAVLDRYRFVTSLFRERSVLDWTPSGSVAQHLIRESGNTIAGSSSGAGAVLVLDGFGGDHGPAALLNRARLSLEDDGVFVVAARVAPTTIRDESGETSFRFESLAHLLYEGFSVVTYAFQHGDQFLTRWDAYSHSVLFLCWNPRQTPVPEKASWLELFDQTYGSTARGMVPFGVDYLRARLRRPAVRAQASKGTLLFFVQPLPLYDDPLFAQTFYERYFHLGAQYADIGWQTFYSCSTELRDLYSDVSVLAPADMRRAPLIRDWVSLYRKTLEQEPDLDDLDLAYWTDYIRFVLDRTAPDAVFCWNKNTVLAQLAAERGILLVYNEAAFDRAPKPPTFFFDPAGVNAESSLGVLWREVAHDLALPEDWRGIWAEYRRRFVEPWLTNRPRSHTLLALGLDPARKTIVIPLQVEHDSNVLGNSAWGSMNDFVRAVIDELPVNRYNVIVKPHPADPRPHALAESVIERVAIATNLTTGDLLPVCDAVFTISSTTGYEALLAGKDVVTFGASAYSGLGFTLDLDHPRELDGWEQCCLALRRTSEGLRERFLFFASQLYCVPEAFLYDAGRQEARLLRWLELRRANSPIEAYWDIAKWRNLESIRSDWDAALGREAEAPTVTFRTAPHPVPAVAGRSAGLEERLDQIERLLSNHTEHYSATLAQQALDIAEIREQLTILNAAETASAVQQASQQAGIDRVTARLAHLALQADSHMARLRAAEAEVDSSRRHQTQLEQANHALGSRLDRWERRWTAPPGKRALHWMLDAVQVVTPEGVRRRARSWYLENFYRRWFPDNLHRQPLAPPARPMGLGSGYPPYLDFKARLYRTLPIDSSNLIAGRKPRCVSVVLPVHNGERYVAESIESVLRQTYGNLELIVVDDGSTDATPRILESFASDDRVTLLRQPNHKLPAALSAGFRKAQGEFWTWISADNVMLPDMLGQLVAFLTAEHGFELVYADQELIGEEGEPLLNSGFCPGYQNPPGSNRISWPRDPGELNFVQNNYIGGCFLYRSWAGALLGDYLDGCFGFEDYEYWMRMNSLFRVAHLGSSEPLYLYRLHSDSLSAREAELRITSRARDFMRIEEQRREFFAESFDITLAGSHGWFPWLAERYRQAGHNVFEMTRPTEEILHRYHATRAFAKSLLVGNSESVGWLPAGNNCFRAVLVDQGKPPQGVDLSIATTDEAFEAGCRLFAAGSDALAYPLLAAANSALHARKLSLAHNRATV